MVPMDWEMLFDAVEFVWLGLFATVLVFGVARRRTHAFGRALNLRARFIVVAVCSCVSVAVEVADEVREGETDPIDRFLLESIRASTPSAALPAFEVITDSGSWVGVWALLVVTCVLLVRAKRHRAAAFVVCAQATAAVLTPALKILFNRARPELWETKTYWGASFPSGHTLGSFCVATSMCIVTRHLPVRIHGPLCFVLLLWAGLVGMSRMVLGVHWPTDVLAAACLGGALPFLVGFLMESVRGGRSTGVPRVTL